MDNKDLNNFLSARSAGIMDNQSKRIEEKFKEPLSIENFTAEIFAECHVCIMEYLKAYNEWLIENFDIKPKN